MHGGFYWLEHEASLGDVSAQTALEISSFQRDCDIVKFKTKRLVVKKLGRGHRDYFLEAKKGNAS